MLGERERPAAYVLQVALLDRQRPAGEIERRRVAGVAAHPDDQGGAEASSERE
jgi:hypothetical protein